MGIELEGQPTWSRERVIGHYGASLDKANSDTEGVRPYAWLWYRELQAMRGSAYRQQMDGLVHAENLALARSEAARTRAAEKLITNALPSTSDEALARWVEILDVDVFAIDTTADVRARAAAKYEAAVGPSAANVDSAVERLLGANFVGTFRIEGTDLATPPAPTFWPTINPGPANRDLGGGTWMSSRAHLVVEVQQIAGQSQSEFLTLVNVHLFRLLDRMEPCWATFNWAIGVSTGFILDVSELDFGGFNP